MAWLALVVALAVGWWTDRRAVAQRGRRETDAVREELDALRERDSNYNHDRNERLKRLMTGES
jgi:hypothetical protein